MALRIGEFSRLARVSVKALRLYDRLGLLKPSRIDGLSGYRYYASEQLPRLNTILALKNLGFSLEQVGRLLDEGLSQSQVRAMLEARRDEAERALEAERERLARVEARLKRMDRAGGVLSGYEVVLKKVEAQRVASVRDTLPAYSGVGRLFDELRDYAGRHGIRPSAWISVWRDEEYKETDVDGEAAFIIAEGPLPEDGRVRESLLPAVEKMASTVHHGSFDTIGGAYAALLGWIEENGYRVAGPNREIYLRGGGEQRNPDYVTEIQLPVEKAEGEGETDMTRAKTKKVDLRKELKHLYNPSAKEVSAVDVPEMSFLMVDGEGNPNTSEWYGQAVEALYAVSYALKFMVKKGAAGVDYAVMPLEGLWWADDMSRFSTSDKDAWKWTMMIRQPKFVTVEQFEEAKGQVENKKESLSALASMRFEAFREGRAAQILHVGPFADEGPNIEKIHRFIDELGHERTGKHHEIYLSDPRRTAPERLKTVIRQPFE